MKKILVLSLAVALAGAAACRKPEPAATSESQADRAAAPADEAPVSLDTPSVLQAIRDGDSAVVLEMLALMTADRDGWAAGDYADLIRPLWNLFARQASPQADAAGDEIQRRVSNLFNLGDWYPIIEDLLIVAADRGAQPSVREAAAEHFWRFAVKAKAGQGFVLPEADKPRIETTVLLLLDDPGYSLQATAAQTAAALGLKAAGAKIKAILGRPGDASELRSLKFTAAEALYELGESATALKAMQALAAGTGDFSEEAAEFLKAKAAK